MQAASLSWCAIDATTGSVLASRDPDRVLSTASVGKVLLLIEVAERFLDGRLSPDTPLSCTTEDLVSDSGLWQHLRTRTLPATDLAVLVGAVSDNLATNVLLRQVGLPAMAAISVRLGLRSTRLLDRVRDVRGPTDPGTLSTGTAAELADLFVRLSRGTAGATAACRQVLDWLRLDTDTSLAASAFGLDPLAHDRPDRSLQLAHKTGSDTGVRADTGILVGPQRSVGYAVLAAFDDRDRDGVLANMAEFGRHLRSLVQRD